MNSHEEKLLLGYMERLTFAAEQGTVTRRALENTARYAQERLKAEREWTDELRERADRLQRSNAALRGQITKLKKRLKHEEAQHVEQ